MAEAQGSLYPPPPSFYKLHGAGSLVAPPPPPAPVEGQYTVYGTVEDTADALPPLQGGQKLYSDGLQGSAGADACECRERTLPASARSGAPGRTREV